MHSPSISKTGSRAAVLALASAACVFCVFCDRARGTEVLFREDFEEAPKAKWEGTVQGETTFGGSKGAIKAATLKDNEWFETSAAVPPGKGPIFKVGKDTAVSFAYCIVKGPMSGELKLQFATDDKDRGNIFGYVKKPVLEKWEVVSVKLADFAHSAGDKKAPKEGTAVTRMNFFCGKPKSGLEVCYDNITVTEGGMPEDLETFVKKREALIADQTATAEKDRFVLSPEIVKSCAEKYKADGVTPKLVAAVGSTNVKSLSFVAPVLKDKFPGYKMVDKVLTAKDSMTLDGAAQMVEKALKYKAEIVFIALDDAEVARGAVKPADMKGRFATLAGTVLDAGAIPVLCTVSARMPAGVYGQGVKAMSTAIAQDAASARVPMLDICAILNPADSPKEEFFSGKTVNMKGHEAVNAAIAELLPKLERHVLGRGPKDEPAAGGPPKDPGKKPPVVDDDDDPKKKTEAKTPEAKTPEGKKTKKYDDE